MFTQEAITNVQDKATFAAAQKEKFPVAPIQGELQSDLRLTLYLNNLPFVGDYVHPHFEKVDEWFVNDTNAGSSLGLSRNKLISNIIERCERDPASAFAITQIRPYEVYIGVYRYVGENP